MLVLYLGAVIGNGDSEFNKFMLPVVRYADGLTYLGKIIVPGRVQSTQVCNLLIQRWASGLGVLIMGYELYRKMI